MLLDEVDGVWGGRVDGDTGSAVDLRTILNGGFSREGSVGKMIPAKGGGWVESESKTYGPKMLAGIGRSVPETVQGRSIRLRMSRAPKGTSLDKARDRTVALLADPLRERASALAWQLGALGYVDMETDAVLSTLGARDQDLWEPLVALADVCGGSWPTRARQAALVLSQVDVPRSPGVQLLTDIRAVFEEFEDPEHLATARIIGTVARADTFMGHTDADQPTGLCGIEGSNWSAWARGRAITPHALGRMLAEYGIEPGRLSDGGHGYGPKGYFLANLLPAYALYCVG
jgi:hypothetical protein